MRYQMREKMFSLSSRYTIRDEADHDVYHVEGKFWTLGDKLSIHDLEGRELAQVHEKLLAWGPTYEITRDGRVAALVKKHLFTLRSCRFTVDVPGPDDLEAAGDLFGLDYNFTRGDRIVAEVSRKWFSVTDTYGIEIVDGEDDVLILASAVVIDRASHKDG
jgi:uncharacterized protein YxjI